MCIIGRIFKEGILASLSGGFYVDTSQGHSIWITHVLIWFFFFSFPVSITVFVPTSLVTWIFYTFSVTFFVSCILCVTHWLHKEFDKYEPIIIKNGRNIIKTGRENGSQLSLEMNCETSVQSYPAAEEIEERCRLIGMAGLYIVDLNAYTRTLSSLNQPLRVSNIRGSANILTNAGETISSLPDSSDAAETFRACTASYPTNDVPCSPPEIEVSRLRCAPSFMPESNAGTFREHFRRYIRRLTVDVHALRGRGGSNLLIAQNPPRSFGFRRSQSSHDWLRFRQSLHPRSHTLPHRTAGINYSRPGDDLSIYSYDLTDTTQANAGGALRTTPDADATNNEKRDPLLLNSASSSIVVQKNETAVSLDSTEHSSETPNLFQFTDAVASLVPVASPGGSITDPRDSPLSQPSSSVLPSAAQVHFDSVRLRKHASSPRNRSRLVSQRRRAIYVSSCSPRRLHFTQTNENVASVSSTSRSPPEMMVTLQRKRQHQVPHTGGAIGRRKLRARRLPLASRTRLPAFPPDINYLDHAYSSPIRNELLSRSDAFVIRNGESAVATISDQNSLTEEVVITDNHTSVQASAPSDRTFSLELQSACISQSYQHLLASSSACELPPDSLAESCHHRSSSLSLSSAHSDTFSVNDSTKMSKRDGEVTARGRTTSLQIKAPFIDSAPESKQQPSSCSSINRLLRQPHSAMPIFGSNENYNVYSSAPRGASSAAFQPSFKDTAITPDINTLTTTATVGDAAEAPFVHRARRTTCGGFASSINELSAEAPHEPESDSSSSSVLFRLPASRPKGGRLEDLKEANRRRRRCTIAYRVRLFSFWRRRFLISLDRLQLSALFDRKPTWLEVCATLSLTTLVSVLSCLLLSSGAFQNLSLSAFCCVVAGCHYSLIKSVQPDPASPRHGFNRLIVYSRSLVFCILTGLFALSLHLIPTSANHTSANANFCADVCPDNFHFVHRRTSTWFSGVSTTAAAATTTAAAAAAAVVPHTPSAPTSILPPSPPQLPLLSLSLSPPFVLYGWKLEALWMKCLLKDICGYLLLVFPLIFLCGLVPQANTLVSSVLEQVDIHVFGGSGSVSLVSVVMSVGRSCAVVALGFAFCYAAVLNRNPQDLLFSIFWGFYLALCFLLSRTPNDVGILQLLFTHITSVPVTNEVSLSISSHLHHCFRRFSKYLYILFIARTGLRCKQQRQSLKRGTVLTSSKRQGRRSQPLVSVTETSDCTRRSLSLPSPSTPPLPIMNATGSLVLSPFNEVLTDKESMAKSNEPARVADSLHSINNMQLLPFSQCRRTSPPTLATVPEGVLSTPSTTSSLSGSSFSDLHDPLSSRILAAVLVRIRNDLFLLIIWAILGFAVHVSTVFTVSALQPTLPRLLTWILIVWGFMLHYVWPQLRKPFPWLFLTRSFCPPTTDGRVTTSEIAYHWCHWFERCFMVPAVTMATATKALIPLSAKFGTVRATIILLITSMKLLRNGFSGATRMFINFFFAEVLFTFDFPGLSETFPVDYFFVSIILSKVTELWYKLSFVYVYIAPFQASWGSICHAVAQLASIPHFISTLGNCIFSTVLSVPLEPFVASVFFIASYARPIRFWEATPKIHRIESTNTPLFSQLRGISFEQVTANLNAIFYEHISRCLQQRLAGDIALGRWAGGDVQAGDIFILASEELHFLLHIVEVGNGLVTFQMRGLEFAGTFCHEQESSGLSEPQLGDRDCCCCTLHRLPAILLSPNSAIRLRWLAWQFVNTPYTIEGYRLIDHSAATSLQIIDFRKIVLALFIQCLLYFTARLPDLSCRLQLLSVQLTERFVGESKVDSDPVFSKVFDEDFDESVSGVTRATFIRVYADWIRYCLSKCQKNEDVDSADDSDFMTLCYAISLLGRRCLGGVSGHLHNALETFLHYLHDVFKGDVQISPKDDWVIADVELLKLVVTPAMRVALKLYQDHFTWNPLSTNRELYQAIWNTTHSVVICHETDPQWRSAVLNDAERLFSFRRIESGTTQQCFRFIMMNRQTLSFKIIKLNSECVRGFWAGQLREQIFLRNKNAERGSIQHAKHVLRNLINSSCDQPVGYPIYVSPLITSFAESHQQYQQVTCPNFSILGLVSSLWSLKDRIKQYCRRSYRCGGGSRGSHGAAQRHLQNPEFSIQRSANKQQWQPNLTHPLYDLTNYHHRRRPLRLERLSHRHRQTRQQGDGEPVEDSNTSSLLLAAGGSELASWCAEVVANVGATTTLLTPGVSSASGLAGGCVTNTTLSTAVVHHTDSACRHVKIVDPSQILNDHLLKLEWPSHSLLAKCLPQSACPSSSLMGAEGTLVHRWTPSNIDPRKRSFCHRDIALITFPEGPIALEGHCVAVWEDLGLEYIQPLNA